MTYALPQNAELVHAGCDWITATARGKPEADSLYDLAVALLNESIARGNERRPWSMAGFHGEQARGCQLGTRDDEVLIRLSGDLAHDYWIEVKEVSTNVSRFDVQLTLRIDCPVGPAIRQHYEQAKRAAQQQGRPATLSLLATNNGPSTIYFNKRISERFGRIYDKGAESGLQSLANTVRYELELKGNAAMSASASIAGEVDHQGACARMAALFFDRRGVHLGKAPAGYHLFTGLAKDTSSG